MPSWSRAAFDGGFVLPNESRTFEFSLVELRDATDDQGPLIVGHAAVFSSPSLDLGGFREIIQPGAFKRSLRANGGDLKSFFNHDPSFVLGRVDNKTLKVKEDAKGLAFEVSPPDTTWASDLLVSLKRGDIRDASFSFSVRTDKWETVKGENLRTLIDVDLHELGPVTNGAYPAADSQVRAMLEARGIKLDDEEAELLEPVLRSIFGDLDLAALAKFDAEVVRAAISILEAKLPIVDPVIDPPSDEWKLAAERRRRGLKLLELKFK